MNDKIPTQTSELTNNSGYITKEVNILVNHTIATATGTDIKLLAARKKLLVENRIRKTTNAKTKTTKEYKMKPNKTLTIVILIVLATACLFALCACQQKNNTTTNDNNCTTNENVCQDLAKDRVSFGKKYYALSANGVDKDQYYQFNTDGTGKYCTIIKEDGATTFQSTINFKWFYAGQGEFVMFHNGTQIHTGKQDTAIGFGRTMHTSKCAMYWDNMYYVSEDCANSIPNYGKITNTRGLGDLLLPKIPISK